MRSVFFSPRNDVNNKCDFPNNLSFCIIALTSYEIKPWPCMKIVHVHL